MCHRDVSLKTPAVIVLNAMIVLAGMGCRLGRDSGALEEGGVTGMTIEQVQERYTPQWMAIEGVVGTAIGADEGRPCILVLTASDEPRIREAIPSVVEGYPVVVRYTGPIRALDEP